MFHKGLNKEIVVETAKELIEEIGCNDFSMRKLADKLGVKTASLYTHIESMEMLFTEVGLSALREQRDCLLNTITEKNRDDALKTLAVVYRCFSIEHPALYQMIMQMPSGENEILKKAAAMTAEPFMQILDNYQISDERKMHWQRVIRGMMHGFVSEEQAGYFSHYPVTIEESYKVAISCIINGLHREERENYGK